MHAEGSSLELVDMVVRRTGRTGNVTGSNPVSLIGFIVIPLLVSENWIRDEGAQVFRCLQGERAKKQPRLWKGGGADVGLV